MKHTEKNVFNIVETATPEFIEDVTTALKKQARPRIPAQTMFAIVAREANYEVHARNVVSVYTQIKPLIEALVLAEVVRFTYVENGQSFYTVHALGGNGAGVKPAGQADENLTKTLQTACTTAQSFM